jgi:hypothetical protein
MLTRNCFYDLLRTYHAPYGFGAVSTELLVSWPGLWGRKNLSPFVGVGSLLVHNIMKRNMKETHSVQTSICSRSDTGFRIQEIQYHPLQMTSNIYRLSTCRFIIWRGGQLTIFMYVKCNSY